MTESSCRVDYFSYTIKTAIGTDTPLKRVDNNGLWHSILNQNCPKYLLRFRERWDYTVPKRRNGYTFGFNVDDAIYCWFNGKDIHIEITGDGCTMLYETQQLLDIIRDNAFGATRIDIAHDIQTDITPLEFGASGKVGNAYTVDNSKSGQTVYLGSKTSNRFVKVYRYNKPHPRAHLLRIEYTYRYDDAVKIANLLKTQNEAVLAFSSATRYEWSHDVWKSLKTPETIKITAHRKDRNTAKTVIWYRTQVLPAIARMVKSGDYTIDQVIKDMKGLANV